jgi:methylamine dehydrogenase accessory protein MauD
VVLIVAAIVLLVWFSFQLLRQNGRLLERIEALEQAVNGKPRVSARGLTVGSRAPRFSLPGLDDDLVSLDDLLRVGRPVMLVFSDPACGPCQALLPAIGRWQASHADQFTLALLSRGSAEENRSKCEEHGVGRVLLQSDWEVSGAYQAYGTPAAVLIGEDGTIASELAQGAEQITGLVERYAQGGVTVMEVPSTNGGSSAPQLSIGEGDEN